jgi:SAM-dependent methyltransferase
MSQGNNSEFSETATRKISNPATAVGRRSTGYLPAPTPAWEQIRSGCEFHLLRYLQPPLFQAPLDAPAVVLDIGCGSGHWALQFQKQFPAATVIGIDTKMPTMPTNNDLGFQFVQGDVLNVLPFPDAVVDYIHLSFMGMTIPLHRWIPLLTECLALLRPGGWIEVQDLGLPYISHVTPWQWLMLLGRANGCEVFPGNVLHYWLKQAGGKDVIVKDHLVQRATDANASARMMIRDGIAVIELCREALLAQHIITTAQYEHELAVMQRNLFTPNRHDTLPVYTAICQKD